MSSAHPAKCQASVVTIEFEGVEVPVPDAEILSAGIAPSEGILILDRDVARYIPKATSDLESSLEATAAGLNKAIEAIQKIALMFTSIGAGMTGATTAPPPTLPTDVLALGSLATELAVISAELETLKGNLK